MHRPVTHRLLAHRVVVAGSVAGVVVLSAASTAVAASSARPSVLTVRGAVSTPATYTRGALAALPQTTVTVGWPSDPQDRQHTDTGVSVDALVTRAGPILPDAKNALLRAVVTVSGATTRTFALGELDSDFGDHDAVVALTQDGRPLRPPELVVPGDTTASRFVRNVRSITVGVANPTPTTPVSPGAVKLSGRGRTVELSVARLAALPAETLGVSFIAGTSSQSHTETGPTLATVLETSGIPAGPNTWVAAVGSDGYVAVVTPAEATTGGRPLLISLFEDGASLPQPRLVADGDIKGGRYVSLLVDLVVGQGAPAANRAP